ncbi:hypothetical protein SAMN04244571_02225 [Azotobacter beijerinckii]|uniref:Uncharacterized protein n=1 Tax=Azotobacter beijerinckii TaxID=170623 RepID=A0A1I1A5K6_9GAMM|nr:hypothetical protein SAMN04244571_02225 [Azotobacter beijerinckii]
MWVIRVQAFRYMRAMSLLLAPAAHGGRQPFGNAMHIRHCRACTAIEVGLSARTNASRGLCLAEGPWHPAPYRGEGVEPRGKAEFFDFSDAPPHPSIRSAGGCAVSGFQAFGRGGQGEYFAADHVQGERRLRIAESPAIAGLAPICRLVRLVHLTPSPSQRLPPPFVGPSWAFLHRGHCAPRFIPSGEVQKVVRTGPRVHRHPRVRQARRARREADSSRPGKGASIQE